MAMWVLGLFLDCDDYDDFLFQEERVFLKMIYQEMIMYFRIKKGKNKKDTFFIFPFFN